MAPINLKRIIFRISWIINVSNRVFYILFLTLAGLITTSQIKAQGYIDCATILADDDDYDLSNYGNSPVKIINGYTYISTHTRTLSTQSLPIVNGVGYTNTSGNDEIDSYVTVLDPNCNQIFGTYLGGEEWDQISSLEVDANGNIIVTGSTGSTDFPTTDGTSIVGTYSTFVTKYAPDGTVLFSSILPTGTHDDPSIVIDGTDFYLLGENKSNTFPTTDGSVLGSAGNGYVAKYDGSNNLVYLTQSGATGIGYYKKGTILNGDLYVFGQYQTSFPTTDGTTIAGLSDLVLVKYDATGNVVFSTVYGGSDRELLDYFVDIISDGTGIYLSSTTQSADFPTTDGSAVLNEVAFLLKYDLNGNLVFSKVYPGSRDPYDLQYVNNAIYLIMEAESGLPVVNGQANAGGTDAYLVKLDADGNTLFSTYYGGGGSDEPSDFFVNASGEIYFTTQSTNALTSDGTSGEGTAIVKLNADGSLCAATQLNDNPQYEYLTERFNVINDTIYIVNQVAEWTSGDNYSTDGTAMFPNSGYDIQLIKFVFCPTPTPITADNLSPSTQNLCSNGLVDQIIGMKQVIDGSTFPQLYDQGVLKDQPDIALKYQWQVSSSAVGPWTDIPGPLAEQKNYSPPPTISDVYYRRLVKTSECCGGTIVSTSDVASIFVGGDAAPTVDAGLSYYICPGNSVTIGGSPAATGGTSPYNYNWNNSAFTIENPSVNPTESTVYTLEVTDANACKQVDQTIVHVYSADAGIDTDVCDGNSTSLGGNPLAGIEIVASGDTPPAGQYSIEYDWSPKDGTLSCTDCPNPSATPLSPTDYTLTAILNDPGGSFCQTSDIVSVGIITPPTSALTIPDTVICLGDMIELSTMPAHPGTTSISNFSQSSTDVYTATIANLTDGDFSTGGRTNDGIGESMTIDLGTVETINIIALGYFSSSDFQFQIEVSTDNISYTDLGFVIDFFGTYGRRLNFGNILTEFIFSPMDVRYIRLSSNSADKEVAISEFEAYYDYNYIWTPGSYISTDRVSAIFDAGTLEMPVNNPITYTVSANMETCSFYEQVSVAVIEARAGKDLGCGPGIIGEEDRTPNIDETYSWVKITDPAITTGSGNLVGATNIPKPIVSASSGGVVGYELTVSFTLNGSTKAVKDTVIVGEFCGPGIFCDIESADGGCPAFDLGNSTMIALSADGIASNWSYSWTSDLGMTGLDSYTTQTVNLTDNITRTYTVTVTNLLDPSFSCTETILANSASYSEPALNVTSTLTVCKGASINIGDPSSNPGLTYSWTNEHLLDNPNSNYPLATPLVSTQFTLRATDNITGCETEEVIQVNVSNSANAGPDITVCDNGIVTLGANLETTGIAYSWSPAGADWRNGTDQNDAMPDVFIASPQTFTVVELSSSCTTSDMVTVTVEALPSPFSLSDLSFCPSQGSPLVLGTDDGTATGLNQVPNGYIYSWSPASLLEDATLQNPTVISPLPASAFTFEVEVRTPGGCNQKASQTINPLVTAAIVISDQVICFGESIAIGSSGNTTGGGITYSWNPSTDLNDPTSPNPIFTSNTAGTTTYTVLKSNGTCSASSEVTITVEDLALPALPPQTICSGSSLPIGVNSEQGFSYEWSPSTGLDNAYISNPIFSGTTSTDFTLTVIDQNGCSGEILTSVAVNTAPVVINLNVPDSSICYKDNSSNLLLNNTVSPAGDYVYQWTPSSYLDNPNILNPTFFFPGVGSYEFELELIDQSTGCRFLDTTNIVIYENCCSTGPTISPINDILVSCDQIPLPPVPVVSHPYDPSPVITYTEVAIFHPSSSWKSSSVCSMLYEVSDGFLDDKGTVGDTSDDEISFTLTIIGKNTDLTWYADINSNLINGSYYTNLKVGPIPSNGTNVTFTVFDQTNSSCSTTISLDASDF